MNPIATIPTKEIKHLLTHTIDTNVILQENGLMPVAIGFEGVAGIGKTSIVRQIAEERGMQFVKLNLAQVDEAGDLCGYPIKEYECQVLQRYQNENGDYKVKVLPNTVWVNEKQLAEAPGPNMKYRQTGSTRMGYAKPAWVPQYSEKGTIVLLDDYNRANQNILKAAMEILYEQSYISWSLPKRTTIVVTQNPDDGAYNVESQDIAQTTRYFYYATEFNLDAWCQWAEKVKLDGRCINFAMSYAQELFNADENGNSICNPRAFVMFVNMISTIKDWDNPDNLEFIRLISRGCFHDEKGRFQQIFASFIRNKMHLLIQPKELLLGKWDDVKEKMKQTVYDSNGQFRPDLASIIERRFVNFVSLWLDSDEKTPINKVKERITDFLDMRDAGTPLFNPDLMIHMVKTIMSDHKNQTGKLMGEPRIAKLAIA